VTSSIRSFGALIEAFRNGDRDAGNTLLTRYQPWVQLLARLQVESHFQSKFDASDVAQQAGLEALRALPGFTGSSEPEFRAWMRQVLVRTLAHEIRRYKGTGQRDIRREESLDGASLEASSQSLHQLLAVSESTPSQRAIANERELALADALGLLPVEYRDVIIPRNLQNVPHEEVARRMNRTPGAVRMLWVRAISALRDPLRHFE
jgi:RNA polymerase sigma-70 factor (ECF subfamily)